MDKYKELFQKKICRSGGSEGDGKGDPEGVEAGDPTVGK